MISSGADDARGVAQLVHQAVADAIKARGWQEAGVVAEQLSVADITSLIETLGQPTKLLQVGGGAGASTAALALAFPNATIVRVDPDLPLGAARGETAEPVARALIKAIGAEQRVRFVAGGFSETVTRRSIIDAELGGSRNTARMVGPETCAREQPFDVAVIEGLSSAEARASDIRLAASALTPSGLIVSAGSVGDRGATVRAGVFEFLRYFPDYTFAHDRLDDAQRTLGFLKRRSEGWAGARAPAEVRPDHEEPMEVRDRIAELVAIAVGKRPILEVAVGAPILGAAFRRRGLATRKLRLTGADWNTHFFDPVIDQICNALDHTNDSVLFSADIMDHAPDEFVGRLFARLEDRRGQALFFSTPPGEAHAAGPRSRPAARIVDLAASQNLRTFALAALEFERARHEGAGQPGWLGGSSRFTNFLMVSRADAGRDARGRNIAEVSPQAVQVREQVELQRIWAEAKLQRSLETVTLRRAAAETERDDALTRWREAAQAVDEERANAERSLVSLRKEIQRLQSEVSALSQDKSEALNAAAEAAARLQEAALAEQNAKAAWAGEADRLRDEASALRNTIKTLESAIADEQANSEAGLRDRDARINELEAELERKRAERAALVLEKDEAESGRRSAETEGQAIAADLRERLSQAEAALERLGRDSHQREAEFESRLAASEARLGDVEEAAELKAKLDASAQELAEAAELHRNELEDRHAEIDDLRAALAAESLQVIDARCREVDAQGSLEGIANHLAATHEALQRFGADPHGFLSDEVPYPIKTQAFEGKDESLVARAGELHGRAADLSREVAQELERLAREHGERESWSQRRDEIADKAHNEALRTARAEFAEEFRTQELLNARVASGLALNNRLLADILALTSGVGEDPLELGVEVAELELAAGSAVSLNVLNLLAAQEKRLLHLLHTLEAEQAMREGDFESSLEIIRDDEAPESEGLLLIESAEEAERVVRPADFGWARQERQSDWNDDSVHQTSEERSTIVAFARPERQQNDDGWSNGDEPVWYVHRDLPSRRETFSFWKSALDRIRTYPETARLVRLQKSLRDELVACPVNPRVFDVGLYRHQGSTEGYAEPLHHYLIEGEKAGWSPLAGFDPAYYATQVGDLGGWNGSLLRHFLSRGVHDRRSPSRLLEGLSDRATAAGMEPLEYFFHWENAARGTWAEASEDDPEFD